MKNYSYYKMFCIAGGLFLAKTFPVAGQAFLDYKTYLQNYVAASGLQFSPDGQSLLYTITKTDWENNRRKTEFVLFDIKEHSSKQLSFKEKNVTQVRWTPSGKYLSYVAIPDSASAGISQLFRRNEDNGTTVCLTSSPTGIISYEWSPGEDMVLYTAREMPAPKTGSQKFITAFEVGNNSYTTNAAPLPVQLYLSKLNGSPPRPLNRDGGSVGDAGWINDSVLFYIRRISPFSGDNPTAQLMLYQLSGNTVQPLASGFRTENAPLVSPDNSCIAYSHPRNNIPANLYDISIKFFGSNSSLILTNKLDRYITGSEWIPDGKSLLLSVANKSKTELVRIGLDKKISWITLPGISGIGEFTVSKTSGLVALTGSTPTQTTELFLYNPSNGSTEKISNNNNFLDKCLLGKTEYIEWPVSGGMMADGIVTYPPDFDARKKYPLVLYIHGGPTAASFVSFSPVVQHLASNGWIIFQPNYRGSLNRGNQFLAAISNDAGLGPGEDIIKGISALKQKGNIDEKKIAVTGWSYGGFMTAWLIGKYPDKWKAAVAGAAPVDLTDMTSLTDLNVSIRHAITSSPWKGDNWSKYMAMSPVVNLKRAKTPTLVMSVVSDERVSVTGSYKIYHALKANNIPVRFFAYPGTGHFPADPVNQNDVYDRWTDWLKKNLD